MAKKAPNGGNKAHKNLPEGGSVVETKLSASGFSALLKAAGIYKVEYAKPRINVRVGPNLVTGKVTDEIQHIPLHRYFADGKLIAEEHIKSKMEMPEGGPPFRRFWIQIVSTRDTF